MPKCPEEIRGGTVEKGWKMKEEIHFKGGEYLKKAKRGVSSPKKCLIFPNIGGVIAWIVQKPQGHVKKYT